MFAIAQLKKNILSNNTLISFLTVGCLSAGIYILLFTVLCRVFYGNYQLAISLSYIVTAMLNFTANRTFTFRNRANLLTQQLMRYLTLLLINYAITLMLMYVVVECAHFPPNLGIIPTIGATCIFSYFVSKFWVYQAV